MENYKAYKKCRIFELRPNAYAYGWSVGMINLESDIIKVPGDVMNTNSYEFNILMATLEGIGPDNLLQPSASTKAQTVDLARRIEEQGVTSLTYSDGLLASCHEAMVNAVDIPVVNILEMIGLVHDYFLGGIKKLCILTTNSNQLNMSFLDTYGYLKNRSLSVAGMQDVPGFSEQLKGDNDELDSGFLNEQVIEYVKKLSAEDPNIKAFLVESNLVTPYSSSIRCATGIPVYDLRDALNFVHLATHQKEYEGDY